MAAAGAILEMFEIGRRVVPRAEVWWLKGGPGNHGAEPASPDEVAASLADAFRFVEEREGGLRSPQLGALHAILAHRSTESYEPITVVMPTGTGKTETMLAAFCHRPVPTVVVVPSDALRRQIAEKFVSCGILPTLGVLASGYLAPVVAVVTGALKSAEEVDALMASSNVLVSTASALARFSDAAFDRLTEVCGRLVVDEAHHVAATTWRAIADRFDLHEVVQFTATPFREDGQHLGGRIAYAYPLRLAQEKGFFAPIRYHGVLDFRDPDGAIARAAVDQLRADLAAGLDHVLMARVRTIPRAETILQLYQDLAPDLLPIRIDSKLKPSEQRRARDELLERRSRVIVCVDMLGEGFDLPALKIAAIHDPHKSLAVTLQFVGRFARVGGDELGEANVFVPRLSDEVDVRLRRLYGEDADWNVVLRDLSESQVQAEVARTEFEAGFRVLPKEVALRSLQPKMSTVVYRVPRHRWRPEGIHDLFPPERLLTQTVAVNGAEHVAWFVSHEEVPVRWGQFSTLAESVHHLYLLHADVESGLLYINSSNNDSLHDDLAKAVCGEKAALIRGDQVYRVLSRVARRVPTNVGLLDAVNRNRRFSMHVGADVLEGFGPTAAQKSKTNIFAYGYAAGARVSFGASRKGRIWSHRVADSLLDWVVWARSVGQAVTDESISVESVMSGFIIPEAATTRPPLVALGIEWPYTLIGNTTETRQVAYAGKAVPLLDLDLELTNWTAEGPITFAVTSDYWSAEYAMSFTEDGPVVTPMADDARIVLAAGEEPLGAFMSTVGMTVFFEQEAVLGPDGYLLQPDRSRPRFDAAKLESLDWTGIDIRRESRAADAPGGTVQDRVIEYVQAAPWDVVLDDDGKGEVADVVCLRVADRKLELLLIHCKFAHGDAPGARLADLYEVCGQATKSHKARAEIDLILKKLIRREQRRASQGTTGFIRGDAEALLFIAQQARLLDPVVTVAIAQPGLSAAKLSAPQAELLGCTELYLNETYGSRLRVLCSP